MVVAALCGDLSLQVLLVSDDFLQFFAFGEQGLSAGFQFEHEGAVVVVPGWGKAYFTILLLSSLISAWFYWMSLSTCLCMPCSC
jgi:hypothetical protein